MLAAIGYWGVRTGGNVAPKLVLALGQVWRIALELLVFGIAGWALVVAGQPVLAVIFAALVVTQRAVLSALGGSDPPARSPA